MSYYVSLTYTDGTKGTCAHNHHSPAAAQRCAKSAPKLLRHAKLQPKEVVVMCIDGGMAKRCDPE